MLRASPWKFTRHMLIIYVFDLAMHSYLVFNFLQIFWYDNYITMNVMNIFDIYELLLNYLF